MFTGILRVDGYAGFDRLIAPDRTGTDIRLAYCWALARRKLVEITRTGATPKECPLRWTRGRSRELGQHRLVDRNL